MAGVLIQLLMDQDPTAAAPLLRAVPVASFQGSDLLQAPLTALCC